MDKLLELAKKGNKRAFKKLYIRYANYFYGYLCKLVHTETIARDIFETTWQSLYLNITTIESMPVALFRTLNRVMENENRRLKNKVSINIRPSSVADLHLNIKLLQLSDADLSVLLEQMIELQEELKTEATDDSLQLKINRILSEVLVFADDYFQNTTMLHDHLKSMFQYREIDGLMTYEINTFIENKQKRFFVLYATLLVLVSIIMIFLGQELSMRKMDTANDVQAVIELEQSDLINDADVALIETSLNGSVVEINFQLINIESHSLKYTDLFIRFPRLTNNSYKLKRVNDVYTLFYNLDYEKLLDQRMLIEVSVSNAGQIVTKEEFNLDLSLLEGWRKIYPINKTIETPLSQLELIDLTLDGPFLSLNMKEIHGYMQSYHDYYVIVEDNNGNQYEGWNNYISNDIFRIEFGNLTQYSTIKNFEIYFESLFYEDLNYIGKIIDDQKSFMYKNHEFLFRINRNTPGRVYFELIADDLLFSEDYPKLSLKETDGWYRLHQNLFPYNVDITRNDYENVYKETDGDVSVEEMLSYYLKTYNMLLLEGDLSYQLQFLPEREFITVLVSDFRSDFLTYSTYFGDTLNEMELAIDSEFRVIEIKEHITVEGIE
ncbi:MAG: hypothetical protein JEZ08_06005 [Clostridiales bacterium]|nr:hypothetical protein [Clostridiales bacterium]